MTSVVGQQQQQQPTIDSREVHFNSSQDQQQQQQQASAVLDYSTAPSAVTTGTRVLPSHSHSWMHPPPLPPQPGTLPIAPTTVTMSANSLYALNDQQQQPTPSCLQQQLQQQSIKVPSTSVGCPGSTGLLMNVMYPPPPPPPPPAPSTAAMPPPNSSGSAGPSQAPQGPLPPPPLSASPGTYGHK